MKTDHFEQLYRGNYARLYYYAFRFVADEEACRDIVNDVFEQAWKDREQLQEATAVACLYTRTRNRCIDYLRHRQVEQQYADFLRTLTSEDPSIPSGEREERVRRMERCLERMTDPTRSIVKQCYYDGKKYREVAEERGITSDGVKKHIVKALRMRRAAWWTALAVAASLALLMMLPLTGRREYTVFRAGPAGGEVKEEVCGGIRTVRIPRGMSRRLVLPDGSRVWLNAESSLSYPGSFGGRERREVTLQGEAYFEVAPDSLHPFVVETAALQTQVLGTSFNVRAYSPEDTRVTLLRGSVKVSDRHRGELLLRPGEGTDCSLGRKTVDDAEDCRAWTDGRFAFDDAPLVEIMRELGRWYNVDIVFTDREVMQERLHFRADRRDSLEQVLELLNCLRKVRARIEDGRVVVGI